MPEHRETRVLPYTPAQMFDLVADVERYPEFLPWCVACRIIARQSPTDYTADLAIGFKMVREQFTSRVRLEPKTKINVDYLKGPFQHLSNEWRFIPEGDGARIEFFLSFEFRSRMLQAIIGVLFEEAVRRMVAAFEMRARKLYGIR